MARLFEHQGKDLLRSSGFAVPHGEVVRTPSEAANAARALGGAVVIKSQVWSTQRASHGGIRFAESPEDAERSAAEMLGAEIQGFRVETLLVEEQIDIAQECFAAVMIDAEARRPRLLFSASGGTGVEEAAQAEEGHTVSLLIDPVEGVHPYQARALVREGGVTGGLQNRLGSALVQLYALAQSVEARSVEINPLVVTEAKRVMALDCRIAIDDYAVDRHPELGIEIAREFSRPPTTLDRIAYAVERGDYRGTFYFMQLAEGFASGEGYVGFHGAGGGGSMMAMDAAAAHDLRLANFTDTSGNPPASKVYRAARIILAQPGIDGYFASGSGVASQEQTNSARGLAKAFREVGLAIPAVVRLGGNREDRAVDLLHTYTADLPAPVEGFKKDDDAEDCAARLAGLIAEAADARPVATPSKPADAERPYAFDTLTGTVRYDHAVCATCTTQACVPACEPNILALDADALPILAITQEAAKRGGCTECLACELECALHGAGGAYIALPIAGLDAYQAEHAAAPVELGGGGA